jgi:two-component system chemotaxis sensor kinase CheA/chemotaxis protein CheC
MRVDVQALGTLNQLAHEGAQAAARALGQMTGIDAAVEVTRISLVDRVEAGEELGDEPFVGVRFEFEGALSGETALVFDREGAADVVDALVPGDAADDRMARSSVEEVGNIMMSGFIDGWADFLGATIDHTPPEYIERRGAAVLPASETGAHDQIFVFRSEVECLGDPVSFYIYMLPAYDPLADLMADHAAGEDAIPIEKLEVFNRMTRRGTEKAAENVETMTGIETTAEVTRTSFCPIEDVPKQVGNDTYVGTVVEFTGTPSGFLLVLFDEPSAVTVAEALMPMAPEGEGLTDRHRSAIEELGNILSSGFVDGWANVLQQSIDHTPPRLVHDMGRAIVDPLAAQLGQHQRHAFTVDSTMRTEDVAFECGIHALPDERQLREALDELLVERAEETEADVERIFGS